MTIDNFLLVPNSSPKIFMVPPILVGRIDVIVGVAYVNVAGIKIGRGMELQIQKL